MADPWLHMYHQNPLPNTHLLSDSDHHSTAPNPDGVSRAAKPVRKRSRASRRTPTTLLTTDPANFRAMVQQFTGGPPSVANHNSPTYAVFDPTAAAHHLHAPPPPLFQFQHHSPPPFYQPAALNGGSRSISNNTHVDYMGLFDGSSPAA